jgi:hypothetical protein
MSLAVGNDGRFDEAMGIESHAVRTPGLGVRRRQHHLIAIANGLLHAGLRAHEIRQRDFDSEALKRNGAKDNQ